MAGQGISINILANVREAVRGADDVASAVEDINDRLHDLTKEGSTATDRMEGDFRELAKESDRTSDTIKQKMRDAYRELRKQSDDAEADTRGSFRGMSKNVEGFKDEAVQNFSEVTSSFDGSMSSIGDLAQGTLGGLASSLPGIGIAAGVAAAGVGLITTALDNAEERRKTLQDHAKDLGQAYIDAGTTVLDAMTQASQAADVLADDDQKKIVEDYAKAIGVDFNIALGAYIGRAEDAAIVQQKLNEAQAEQVELAGQGQIAARALVGEKANEYRQNRQLIDSASELLGVGDSAVGVFKTQSDWLRHLATTTEGATQKVDELGDSVYTLPKGQQIYVDAETGQATMDVDAIENKIYGIHDQVVNVTANTADFDAKMRALQNRSYGVGLRINATAFSGGKPIKEWIGG